MSQMEAPPDVAIPPSNSTVKISIIDTGCRVCNVAPTVFMEPPISTFQEFDPLPAYSFLIEHQNRAYVFDLGIRKDPFDNLPPTQREKIKKLGWRLVSDRDVLDVLVEQGVDPKSINGVIWSHWHFDHTGDPSRFPASTDLVVGPGFKAKFLPGYPEDLSSSIDSAAWKGRELKELVFKDDNRVAGFRAIDLFDDGSFYLLDVPGHAIGHMCGLARTTPNTFILLGADTCHHAGEFRPSSYLPLPPCPGEAALLDVHPSHSRTEPYFTVPGKPDGQGVAHSRAASLESIGTVIKIDSSPDVLVVMAHDSSLLDTIDVYPAAANDWREMGWKERSRWKFLDDLRVHEDKS